jgi:hypothetical protein
VLAILRRHLEELFGSDLAKLLTDRALVFEKLRSPIVKERCFALLLLRHHWHLPTDIMEPICRSLIMNDPDPQMRGAAASVLGQVFCFSFDEEVSSFLASIAIDELNPIALRRAASFAIRNINQQRIPDDDVDNFISRLREEDLDKCLPIDINWVKTFIRRNN